MRRLSVNSQSNQKYHAAPTKLSARSHVFRVFDFTCLDNC